MPLAIKWQSVKGNQVPNKLIAIDLTIIVVSDGMDDYDAYTRVRDYIEELGNDKGVRVCIYEGETRQLTKHELAITQEDPKFIDAPFDEHE